MSGFETLGDFALSELEPSDGYRVEMAAEGLDFDPALRSAPPRAENVGARHWRNCWPKRLS